MEFTYDNKQEIRGQAALFFPFQDHIIDVYPNDVADSSLVTWIFPNHELVQMIFYSEEHAKLFSMSPHLVLPMEGEDDKFYTSKEIELFLSSVKNYAS